VRSRYARTEIKQPCEHRVTDFFYSFYFPHFRHREVRTAFAAKSEIPAAKIAGISVELQGDVEYANIAMLVTHKVDHNS